MIRLITGIIFISAILCHSIHAEISENLWNISLDPVKAQTVRSYRQGSIQVEEVYYESRPYNGKPVKIFGYFCFPAKIKDKIPAILLVHGGGGSAHLGRSLLWARRGYAVLTIDLPGRGEQRMCSRSTGPDMDVPVLLRTNNDNYLVHAVAAARNGITYLTQRKEVDPERIGMVGLSWGGVITLLTNGQDKRLKTAVNVFGAGYIPEGCTWQERFKAMSEKELNLWYSYIDPKNFLKTQHAPILFTTGTNDHCYYLPTFQKSYEEVTVPKKLLLLANLRHQFFPYMQSIVWNWLDNKLKNTGSFPEITAHPVFENENGKVVVPVTAKASSYITNATLYYATGGPSLWTAKSWKSLKGYYKDGIYYFGIPASLIKPEVIYYVSAKDNHGSISSTPIRSLFKVILPEGDETFAVTSPITRMHMHERPLQILDVKDSSEFQIRFSKKDKTYYLKSL